MNREVGALVDIRDETTGKWFLARITALDAFGFEAVPTGAPIKGWLGENKVLRAWENQYGQGGYNTWDWPSKLDL